MTATTQSPPAQSAVSQLITKANASTETEALPYEVLHNLKHQHGWRSLRIHSVSLQNSVPTLLSLDSTQPITTSSPRPQPNHLSPSTAHNKTSRPDTTSTTPICYLISGLPPKHSYVHPDLQMHLIKHKLPESSLVVQREWVLPASIGEEWSLRKFASVFDALPAREKVRKIAGDGGELGIEWTDSKRVLLGMVAANGMGGDGTVVYYIMHEGEVKPRQNG